MLNDCVSNHTSVRKLFVTKTVLIYSKQLHLDSAVVIIKNTLPHFQWSQPVFTASIHVSKNATNHVEMPADPLQPKLHATQLLTTVYNVQSVLYIYC